MNIAALGIVCTWGMIMICHLVFVRRARQGRAQWPAVRLWLSPWTELATLAFLLFLLFVLVEMGVNGGDVGRWTVLLIVPIVLVLTVGWRLSRRRA